MKTTLKQLFFFAAFLACCNLGHAATYYFSSIEGNDARTAVQAQDPSTPWKTISKLNAVFSTLKPGDSILFKRGETFLGSINLIKSGASGNHLVIGAYGSGAKPVITSLVSMTNWSSAGNGIYSGHSPTLPKSPINILLLNNVKQEMGRFPNSDDNNKGFRIITSHVQNSSITDNTLPASPSWTGAEVVIRKNHWILDRHKITSHSGTKISYSPTAGTSYSPKDGFGYFIQNHVRTLDKLGEWYYDPAAQKMSVFFGSKGPSAYQVKVSTQDYLVSSSSSIKYVTFENLHFQGANKDIFHLKAGDDVRIQNCDLEHAGENGISVEGITNLLVENNKILSSNNNGMFIRSAKNAVIKNNLVKDTNMIPGMGKSGDSNGVGIFSPSDNNLIEYNQVINTGYVGIRFGGNNTVVKNNLVDYFCMTKNDGSGIYAYTGKSNQTYSNRKVIGNIVLNGIGVREGTDLQSPLIQPLAEGIYLDDNTSGVEVSGNTIANIASKGIYLHNARDNKIVKNLVYNSNNQMVLVSDDLGDDIRNNNITENIFFSKSASQNHLNISSIKDDVPQMGSFDKNVYASPFSDNYRIITRVNMRAPGESTKTFDLESWKKEIGKDKNSKIHPIDIAPYKVEGLLGNNKYINKEFTKDAKNISCNNCTSSWVNNPALDAGSLKVKGSGSFEATFNVGAVTKDKQYVLRFSGLGNKSFVGKIYLRSRTAPMQAVSAVTNIELTAKRTEYEAVFKPVSNLDGTSVIIRIENVSNAEFSIDNFEFYEAKIALVDTEKKMRFEYNYGSTEKTLVLDGSYVDMKNVPYSGSVKLAPYSSIILFKTENAAPKSNATSSLNPLFKPIYLNAGSADPVSREGKTFEGDKKYSSYFDSNSTYSNSGASTEKLFQTERNGKKLSYSIPVPAGTYTVTTYHHELFFDRSGPSSGVGKRVFDLSLEGKLVKDNLDLFVQNGNKETVLVFRDIVVSDGVLNLNMEASANNASISGIAIEAN